MATISIADSDARVQYTQAVTANSTQLTIDFPFFSLDDINVIVTSAAGVDTALTRGTGTGTFAVNGTSVDDGFSGGNITLGDSYSNASTKFTIFRDIPVTRTTDFPTSGPFNVSSLNTELDRIIAIEQELETKIGRTMKLAESDSAATLSLPNLDTRKGTTLAFNSTTGLPEAGPKIGDVSTIAAITADIGLLADIQDGTTATNAITTVSGISANVTTVAGISSNVTSVAGNATNINSAVSNASNINTVAGISSDITTVAGKASLITSDFIADLNTLAVTDVINDINLLATSDIVADLNTLATSDIVSDLNTLATSDIVSDINTLATNDIVSDLNLLATSDFVADLNTLATTTNVNNLSTVAGISSNVSTVAGVSANVTTVAGISSDVTAVAGDATDIGTVATSIANVNTVAGIAANVTTVANDGTDIGTVAGISSNVTTVAGISSDVTTVAGNNANVTTVAGANSNISTVASSIANVNTVATNLSSINDFADKYRIGATDPTSNNDVGDLFYNTTSNTLKVFTGSAFEAGVTAGSGFAALSGANFTGAVDVDDTLTANTIALDNGSNDWSVTVTSNNLIFSYAGTAKMKVDSSGNLTVTGDIISEGTI